MERECLGPYEYNRLMNWIVPNNTVCFNCKGIGTYVTRASSSKLDMHPYKAPICSAVTDWSFRPDVHGAHSKRCCVAAHACIENVQLENLTETRDRA